jgi:hypothetical protein
MSETRSESKQRRRYLSLQRVAVRVIEIKQSMLYWITVAEVELDDMTRPAAAGDPAPLAAVVVSLLPRDEEILWIARDAGLEGEQRSPLGREAAPVGCGTQLWLRGLN